VLGEEIAIEGDVVIDEVLQQTGAYEETALNLAMLVLSAGSFIVVLLVTKIILTIIEQVLGFIHELPLIGKADTALGVVAGVAKTLLITWMIMAVVALLSSTENGAIVTKMIYESVPLAWLYEHNVILNVILSFL